MAWDPRRECDEALPSSAVELREERLRMLGRLVPEGEPLTAASSMASWSDAGLDVGRFRRDSPFSRLLRESFLAKCAEAESESLFSVVFVASAVSLQSLVSEGRSDEETEDLQSSAKLTRRRVSATFFGFGGAGNVLVGYR